MGIGQCFDSISSLIYFDDKHRFIYIYLFLSRTFNPGLLTHSFIIPWPMFFCIYNPKLFDSEHQLNFIQSFPGVLICRVTEEHLWESRQLGAHSPKVLLNTLIYFNTKYFHLNTPEAHTSFTFVNVMKTTRKKPGSADSQRTVYLRYNASILGGWLNKLSFLYTLQPHFNTVIYNTNLVIIRLG